MATKILERLYLGDINDAITYHGQKDWITINVLEKEIDSVEEDYYIPILERDEKRKYHLNWSKVIEATDMIERVMQSNPNAKVLLHCGAGQERSPLVMQYYLVRYMDFGADEAFEHIQFLRPIVIRTDKNYGW